MDPVSTFNQIAALLQQQLSRRDQTGRTSQRSDTSASARQRAGETSGSVDTETALRHLMATLRPDNELDGARMGRAAIELIVNRDFPAGLANEPEFQQMIDSIHQVLEEDPQAHAMLLQLCGISSSR
jgi:hypothetical protein